MEAYNKLRAGVNKKLRAIKSILILKCLFRKISLVLLRSVLNFLLIFQLAVYPAYGQDVQRSNTQSKLKEKAKSFNEKHVESLREYIFGKKNVEDYYRNHPLDTFSLLGQTVVAPEKKESLKERLLRKSKKEKELSADKKQLDPSLIQRRNIELENLLIEIVSVPETTEEIDSTEALRAEPSKMEVQSILAHPSRQGTAGKVLTENLKDKLNASSTFVNSSKKKLSFRFFHHGEVVQTFPQNIEWMVFFGDFLVFLEASKISDSKALLSFIDLKYFQQAIGKTGLPIFQIPINYKTAPVGSKALLEPEVLQIKTAEINSLTHPSKKSFESVLKINDLELSESQLSFLSSIQQLSFNTTVSLLNPENSDISLAYLKEIVKSYSEGLKEADKEPLLPGNISLDTKQMTLKLLEHRKEIGSAKNVSGSYGLWNKIDFQLSDESKATKEFKESLVKDRNFQSEVDKTYQAVAKKRAFWNRYFAFLNDLTRPQPLGSPEITKSLGLIANSVSLKKDSVKNRFETFKEGVNQFLYPKTNRLLLAGSALVGAGAIAPAETANSALFVLDSVKDWTLNFWELISVTANTSFAWVNPDKIYSSYFKGDSFSHFLTGVSALAGVGLFSIGVFHYSINTGYLIKSINSTEFDKHQNKARQYLDHFISYMSQSRSDFIKNLTLAEKKKLGILSSLSFLSVENNLLFKTTNNLSHLYQALDSIEEPLSLELKIEKENVITQIDFIQKVKTTPDSPDLIKKLESDQSSLDPENEITLRINGSSAVFINKDIDIKLKNFFDPETKKLQSDISISLEISNGQDLSVSGNLENAEFADKDNKRIKKILGEIESEKKKRNFFFKKKTSPFNESEIKTLYQALGEFSLGYSSWSKTFQFVGLSWNWFFIGRHIGTRPSLIPKIFYYSKYFKVSSEGHFPTVFNGGRQDRLNRSLSQIQLGFKKTKEFENYITNIEKKFLEEVNAQAYLAVVEEAGAEEKADFTVLGPKLNKRDIQSKRLKIFYGLYQRELFEASIRDYLSKQISQRNFPMSDHEIKKEGLKKMIEDPEFFKSLNPTKEEIRKTVEWIAKNEKITQKSKLAADNLIKGFLKRVNLALENKAQDNLNPKTNLQMQRASVSKKLLNDPESLARATRQQITYFMIDKPIELLYTFVFLAGVDQGILRVLHDQAFTEEAWFHLGRYAIWAGFFAGLCLEILAGVWMKTQMDSRLEEMGGFDSLPTQGEVKTGYLRWVKKQFISEDNTWWENQKFAIKIAWANLLPGTILVTIIWVATLGRFDLELFLASYMIYFVTPLMGLGFKLENTFEKSSGYAHKKLIEKGLDLSGEDKKFLAHPKVQENYMKESLKLRRKFNLWLALIYNNPIGNILDIFSTTHTSQGAFGLVRLLPVGELPTQHWANFMDFLENKNILSSDFAEKCKSIFTNNRPDIK